MEIKTVSLFNSVPSFARGSDILLVHSEILSLGYIASLLRQCAFRVTATNQASAAIDIICQQEGKFKLVMAKATMPDMSTLSFLNTLHLKGIPVIFVSTGESNDKVARAALERGLCHMLEEPIQPEDLIQVWHQVYYPNNNLAREIFRNAQYQDMEATENQNKSDEKDVSKGKQKRKRARASSHHMNLHNNHDLAEEDEDGIRELNDDEFAEKRLRITWTPELHNKFLHAISILGENNIRPKQIQQMMNVRHLTCRHISSHLQKFKSQVRHLQEMCNNEDESPNFNGKTQSSSSLESQSYPEYLTLASFHNEIQNQNQFKKNSVETQEQVFLPLLEAPFGNLDFSFQNPTEDLFAVVGEAISDASRDKNQNLAEYNNNSNFLGEDDNTTLESNLSLEFNTFTYQNQKMTTHDDNSFRFLGEEDTQSFENILRNTTILESNAFIDQNQTLTNYNYIDDSSFRILEQDQDQTLSEYNRNMIFRFLGEEDSQNYDHQTWEEYNEGYNNINRILEEDDDFDEFNCFGKDPSPEDIATLRDAIFGDTSSTQQQSKN